MFIALVSIEDLYSVEDDPLRSAQAGTKTFSHAFGFRPMKPSCVQANYL